tara:strand:+ start:362 stop:1276 length:915 start_codon:yes stop_codon:yes gene_type:complete
MHANKFSICSFYKFTYLKDLEQLKKKLIFFFQIYNIKGTVLISKEGVNGSLSIKNEEVDNLKKFLGNIFNVQFKFKIHSFYQHCFLKSKVKIKSEIIKLNQNNVDPIKVTGQSLTPHEWNNIVKNNQEFIILDVRNKYESQIGTFKKALVTELSTFTEFPNWIEKNKNKLKDKKIAMFCTGGIRCEKASAYMMKNGYKEVYQLEGGIFNYLSNETNTNKNWIGECFVFDDRVSVNKNLDKGKYSQCFACRNPITEVDKKSPFFKKGISCPHCFSRTSKEKKKGFEEREKQIVLAGKKGINHIGD